MSFTARHKMLAFYGVPNSGGTVTYTRMKYFTQLTQNKNPQEYSGHARHFRNRSAKQRQRCGRYDGCTDCKS